MKTITLAPHEFHANLLYNDDEIAHIGALDLFVSVAVTEIWRVRP